MEGINVFYEFNGNKRNYYTQDVNCNLDLYNQISSKENLPIDFFKIVSNGKYLSYDETAVNYSNDLFLNINLPLCGGKGGFGSMLRAIGAQIEKTTNRDACRDLTGRRLRDINAEKRIKNWIRRKAELEKEKARQKREKLERLTQQPKIDFKDDDYLNEKDEMPQKVDDAIDYALKKKPTKSNKTVTSTVTSSTAVTSSTSVKSTSSIVNSTNSESSKDNQACSSSSNSDSNLSDSNENSDQACTSSSNDNNSPKASTSKINKRKVDEPAVVSKKKKVGLWLGDDLDSDDTDDE